jgi:hypothetical protein
MRKIRPLLPLLFLIISIEGIQAQNNVGIGTTNPQAKLDINGDIIIRGFALPAVDGVNTSLDINTDRFSNYKIFGPTADFVIAGITAGMDGRLITLQNKSGFIMQLTNEDISALPEDQIITGTGTTIDINASGSITLQYDVDLAKWIVLSKNHILSGGGGGSFWDLSGNNIFNNNSGNIGIGLSNPGYKLTIRTGTRDYGFIHTDGTITFGSYVGSSAATGISAGWLGTISQHQLNIFTGNGTAQAIFKTDYGFDLVGPKPYMRLLDGSTVSGDFRADVANLEIAAFKANLLGVPGNIILQADDISQFSSKYAGNVGIGLRNPIGRLHIVHGGPTAHLILEFPGLNDYSRLLFTNTGASRYWGIAGKASTGSINGDRLSFYNNGGAEVMVMTGDGNVGIGTPNPTYRLAVNGNIRSKEVVVESGWADYVFDHHYKLPTLAELETFINQNKHLPNVPSAQEIAENGLAVGDVQRRMMEKIEELTLYVIQLKKEIEELKSNRK